MIQGSRESKEHVVHKSNNMHKSKAAEFILKKKKKKIFIQAFPNFCKFDLYFSISLLCGGIKELCKLWCTRHWDHLTTSPTRVALDI